MVVADAAAKLYGVAVDWHEYPWGCAYYLQMGACWKKVAWKH